jgi:hypothetical protein
MSISKRVIHDEVYLMEYWKREADHLHPSSGEVENYGAIGPVTYTVFLHSIVLN